MSEFLDRNKKRGPLAVLFRDRRVLAVLVLTALVVLSFVFIAPSDFTGGASDSSVSAGSAGSWSRLMASFGAIKRDQGLDLVSHLRARAGRGQLFFSGIRPGQRGGDGTGGFHRSCCQDRARHPHPRRRQASGPGCVDQRR